MYLISQQILYLQIGHINIKAIHEMNKQPLLTSRANLHWREDGVVSDRVWRSARC